jgi:hypothetical protein
MTRDQALARYRQEGHDAIGGWLDPSFIEFALVLDEAMRARGTGGAGYEVGSWQGKFLCLLSLLIEPACAVVSVDPFTHCEDPERQLATLRHNVARFAWHPERVTVIREDSSMLPEERLRAALGGPACWIHVDGDHTATGALLDLRMADRLLGEGGVLVVDDVSNMSCPGVIEACVRFGIEQQAREDEAIVPFLVAANKLCLTQRRHAEAYRQAVLAQAVSGRLGTAGEQIVNYKAMMQRLGIPVQLCGSEVLVPAG